MHDVAKSFKMKGYEINDDPELILNYKKFFFKEPLLLNIKTNRLFWHSGAGQDNYNIKDRYEIEKKKLGLQANEISKRSKRKIDNLWQKQLDKL